MLWYYWPEDSIERNSIEVFSVVVPGETPLQNPLQVGSWSAATTALYTFRRPDQVPITFTTRLRLPKQPHPSRTQPNPKPVSVDMSKTQFIVSPKVLLYKEYKVFGYLLEELIDIHLLLFRNIFKEIENFTLSSSNL